MGHTCKKQEIIKTLMEYGVSQTQCEIIADVMVTADSFGVKSHGSKMLDAHIKKLKNGGYNLYPNFKIIRENAAFSVIDGDNSFGFVCADYCMKYAVEKAKTSGMFCVFSKNNNTFGPAFYYPYLVSKEKMIGIVFSNSPAQMAPIGGKEKMLGTNPFAAVIPVPGKEPIIIDMATSIVAKSRFKQYKEAGLKLPNGWALDRDGNPTNDPDEGIRGLVQPMAGFKGYSIALLIDVLSGVLSGASFLNKVNRFYSEDSKGMDVGFCCIAIDPYEVLGEEYDSRITEFVELLRNSDNIEGMDICIPGDDRHHFKNFRISKQEKI